MRSEARSRWISDDGVALVAVLMLSMLLLALAGGLAILTLTESRVEVAHRHGLETFYAADGTVERIAAHLRTAPDVDAVLAGAPSVLNDGPAGTRATGETTIDLVLLTNALRCGAARECSDAEMNAVTADRPWGPNNPRWRLYAYGPFGDLAGMAAASAVYVAAWVADDPAETDGDPLRDEGPPAPGHRRLAVRVHAYGRSGTFHAIDAILAGHPEVQITEWRSGR